MLMVAISIAAISMDGVNRGIGKIMMGKLRLQFMALLLTVITLFLGVVMVDLYFFGRMTSLYRLETKVAIVFLNWTRLVGQSSGYIFSNETVGQAYITWKKEYDAYSITWQRDVDELETLAGVDNVLADKITWVRETIDLGVKQMDLMDKYLGDFMSDLRLHQPDIIDRNTMASLSDNQNTLALLSIEDEFYLNKVRHSCSLLGDMMAPAIRTSQTRFQNQIADRIQAINDQFTRIRIMLIGLILGVLIVFLIRIVQLNFDLMVMVKQRTSELVEAKERAETVNRAKSVFLANMSHELRTPLSAVLGFSHLMHNDLNATTEQREYLNIITRNGEHLLNLINNVLDISKIESGRVLLEESATDLHQLIQEMQSLMHVKAQEKGLDFTVAQSPDFPRHAIVDAGKLRQVLINLIGNAVKFTHTGGVLLRAEVVAWESPQAARARFQVQDSGPGIRAEDMGRIFTPFEQLTNQPVGDAGTGLGLAISQQYVELMGGQLGVTSEIGTGSVFSFEIPVAALPVEEMPAGPRRGRVIGIDAGQPRYRLLIAEDQPENRLLLVKLLEPLGLDVRTAVNGQEAVEIFEHWHPDVIWMDMRMPVMDGLEATRRIKRAAAGARTKVIALTAHALEEERRAILAAGCDDFIRKPYRDAEIFDALAKHLGLRFRYAQASPPAAEQQAGELTADHFRALPPRLTDDLFCAAELLDGPRLLDAIRQIGDCDHDLGERLRRMVDNVQYKELLTALDRLAEKRNV